MTIEYKMVVRLPGIEMLTKTLHQLRSIRQQPAHPQTLCYGLLAY